MANGAKTFVQMFDQRVEASRHSTALKYVADDGWVSVTWQQWSDMSRRVAAGLIALGVGPGDKAAILSETRYEWVVSDLGIMTAGAVTVPIYPSEPAERCAWILNNSEARVVFVEDIEHLTDLYAHRDQLGTIDRVITVGCVGHDSWCISFEELLAMGDDEALRVEMLGRSASLTRDSVATIVYTSGTTGHPKGVVLTHGNFAWECETVQELGLAPDDVQLLVLPLAHIFARVLYAGFIRCGGVTAFAEADERLADALQVIKPTFFAGVPRLYEQIYNRVIAQAQARGGFHRRLFDWARDVGEDVCAQWDRGREPVGGLKLKHDTAIRLIGRHVQDLFGGQIRFLISGQAALAPAVSRFFFGFGLEVLEGYGLTETTAATHANRPGSLKFGTVGTPFHGVETRFAKDGEILIRGPNIMRGYYKAANATAAVLDKDGWFHTGDIGEVDEHGFLRITDRKKNIIVTKGGKNVAPQNIENQLTSCRYVAHAMVHGDARDYLTALITLDLETTRQWAAERGLKAESRAELSRHPEIYKLIEAVVQENNAAMASYEAIRKFAILDSDFTTQGGELTPTMKVRRKIVTAKHKDLLESFYTERY